MFIVSKTQILCSTALRPACRRRSRCFFQALSTTTTTAPPLFHHHPHHYQVLVDGLTLTEDEQLKNPVVDKILGCIYGNCLGDAFGLSTEFMTKAEVTHVYGDSVIPFPYFKRNFHNRRWVPGDWTDDSDQMLLIMEMLTEEKQVKETVFAKKLLKWIDEGFSDLGDTGGMGLGATVHAVCSHSKFLSDPHVASKTVWERNNKNVAANGAVMRTSVLGCFEHEDLNKVIANTTRVAQITHWDPRCVASCITITTLIAQMLQGKKHETLKEREALIDVSKDHAVSLLEGKQKEEYLQYLNGKTLEDFALSHSTSIGYTLKCSACGVYAMRTDQSFKATLNALAHEGGDADTNGAVCGAVLGCRLGYSKLPADWLNALPHKKWLDKKVVAFLKTMKLV
eukprot:TRINITY_DN97_c0_g1_i4.p1 TRINITY_DN97_c0_g1~~TRINITY_DN97_c0_g1_i4.p1  ORF type:complete len:396 (+),score=90.05 TRINITY_DN97_c0_g1_i4:188-1375(+)